MPGYTIVRFMNSWNPISVMVVTAFIFALGTIGWYVVTNMVPPQWILALGTAIGGAVSFAGGGTLTALHATTIAEQTRATIVEARNGTASAGVNQNP